MAMSVARNQHRIAVRPFLRDEFGRCIGAGAGTVFYHDGLSESFACLVGDRARQDVDASSGAGSRR